MTPRVFLQLKFRKLIYCRSFSADSVTTEFATGPRPSGNLRRSDAVCCCCLFVFFKRKNYFYSLHSTAGSSFCAGSELPRFVQEEDGDVTSQPAERPVRRAEGGRDGRCLLPQSTPPRHSGAAGSQLTGAHGNFCSNDTQP